MFIRKIIFSVFFNIELTIYIYNFKCINVIYVYDSIFLTNFILVPNILEYAEYRILGIRELTWDIRYGGKTKDLADLTGAWFYGWAYKLGRN